MAKILVNGVFDCWHVGHINLLLYARELAGEDKLIVCVDEDQHVMSLKGLQRPIFDVDERMRAVAYLKYQGRNMVDIVESFSTNLALLHLIRKHQPDILVKGSDWEGKTVVGSEFVKKVVFFPRMDYSTSDIVRRVIEKHTILK